MAALIGQLEPHLSRTVGRHREALTVLRVRVSRSGDELLIKASAGGRIASNRAAIPEIALCPNLTSSRWNIARSNGLALFNAVFSGEVRGLYRELESRGNVAIELHVDDPLLESLPWELMRDPERDTFLALQRTPALFRFNPATKPIRGQARPERSRLRVFVEADSLDESQVAFIEAFAADPAVDVSAGPSPQTGPQAPHIVQRTITPATSVAGRSNSAIQIETRNSDLITIPSSVSSAVSTTFLTALYRSLAKGAAIAAAVAHARREVAERHGIVELTWTAPVLYAASPVTPLVVPVGKPAVKPDVRNRTIGWLKETAIGMLVAIGFMIAGLALLRFGLSSSNQLAFDLLSPWELFTTFRGIVLTLSTRNENLLLLAVAVCATLTLVVAACLKYLPNRRGRKRGRLAHRAATTMFSARMVAFLTVTTLVVLGAYAYQQYLWRVQLPIARDALGIAITREVAAASLESEMADSLFSQGKTGQIVVRELPIAFDATNVDTARKLGNRIGAKAVIVYRPEQHEEGAVYAADVVFADPAIGLEVGTNEQLPLESPQTTPTQPQVQIREGVAIPAIRSGTLPQLINAAGGVIAYQNDQPRQAIELLRLALAGDQASSDVGIVNFYLGNAYNLDNQPDLAISALNSAIGYYQEASATARLSPQDQLVLAKSYEMKGWVERGLGNWSEAVASYQSAAALHDPLTQVEDQLARPAEVHATFARIYTDLTDSYRFLEDRDQEATWRQRAIDEIKLLEATGNTDPEVNNEVGVARFLIGDCTGGMAALNRAIAVDPANTIALKNGAIVASRQTDMRQAEALLRKYLALKPNDVASRITLTNLLFFQGLDTTDGFLEPAFLDQAEQVLNEILAVDPANLEAHRLLADIASFRASSEILDAGALLFDLQAAQKSQLYWPAEPDRLARALAYLTDLIDQRRLIALELQPGNAQARLDLIDAYSTRLTLLYGMAMDRSIVLGETPDLAKSDLILADAAIVTEWTDRVLSQSSDATRAQRLSAWAYRVQALSDEWGWNHFFLQNEAASARIAATYRDDTAKAVAEVEAFPPTGPDEARATYLIYNQAAFVALALDQNDQQHRDYLDKAAKAAAMSFDSQLKNLAHTDTMCDEVRERAAGDDRAAAGNLPGAIDHYRASLKIDGQNYQTLTSLATALFISGNTGSAIKFATDAIAIDASRPEAFADLGLYRLASGDHQGSESAYSSFIAALTALPLNSQLQQLDRASRELLAWTEMDGTKTVATEAIDAFEPFLDGYEVPATVIYEYARVYERLGEIALINGDPATGERLLRKSLQADPHRPRALTLLAIAKTKRSSSASDDIQALVAELSNPNWANGSAVTSVDVKDDCLQAIDIYLNRFPSEEEKLRDIQGAIEMIGK